MIWDDEKEFWEFRNSKEGKTLRFWQALLTFTGAEKITVTHKGKKHDTYYYQDVKLK